MPERSADCWHRFIDEIDLDIETDGLGHEISFTRLREIIDGYSQLLTTVNDARSHDPNDTRVVQNESSEKKSSHTIYLSPAKAGSFRTTAKLYDDSGEAINALPLDGIGFTPVFKVIKSVTRHDAMEFEELLPSKLARSYALDAISKLWPKENEVIRVASSRDDQINMEFPKAELIDFHDLKPASDDYVDAVVIGSICSVDFESHKLKFRPSKSTRKFTVCYDPDIEDRLVTARKRTMTVNCRVQYDLNGNIADMAGAEGIEELEISDVSVNGFIFDGKRIEFKKPLTAEVSLDEDTGQVFIGRYEPLGMVVYAEYQDELIKEILDDIEWRWRNLALAPDEKLSPSALGIKKRFLEMVVR